MYEFSINKPDKNRQYIKRPGAYGIIEKDKKLVAVVKTKTGYFLPGGGIENEESPEECLKRECLEEIGTEVSILDYFAIGNYYFYSTTLNKEMESIGHFFTCKIDKFLDIATELDHELIWLEPEQAIKLLYLDNQREALNYFKKNKV